MVTTSRTKGLLLDLAILHRDFGIDVHQRWHQLLESRHPFLGVAVSIHGVHRVVCIYFVEIDLDVDVDVDVVNRNNVACSSNDDNCSMQKVANKLK